MSLKQLVPLRVRDRIRPIYWEWIRWPKPLWRLRGRGGFTLGADRFELVDVARRPHDWWAWQARNGSYEPEVVSFLSETIQPGDVFFDIGVYIGAYSLLGAARVGAAGQVVGFEPDPFSQVTVQRNLLLNGLTSRVRLVAAAVSDHNGPIMLNATHLGESTSSEGPGTFEARCVRLDDWCDESGVWPDVIKMDIEGAEVAALGRHARRAVQHARAIVLEVHEDRLVEQGQGVQRILDWLTSTGKIITPLESRWTGNFNIAAVAEASCDRSGSTRS